MPIALSDLSWQNTEIRNALRARDMGSLFRYVQHHSGASQARIAVATGMTQGRVNELINRRREVSRLDVFERIADGLGMPDDARRLLGLAPQRENRPGALPSTSRPSPRSCASTPTRLAPPPRSSGPPARHTSSTSWPSEASGFSPCATPCYGRTWTATATTHRAFEC